MGDPHIWGVRPGGVCSGDWAISVLGVLTCAGGQSGAGNPGLEGGVGWGVGTTTESFNTDRRCDMSFSITRLRNTLEDTLSPRY